MAGDSVGAGERSFKPISGNVMPRFSGIATFMRLPHVTDPAEAEIGLVGVPWDGGTTNRAGARHGPRQIRDASTMTRSIHHVSGIRPFDLCRRADLGTTAIVGATMMLEIPRILAGAVARRRKE